MRGEKGRGEGGKKKSDRGGREKKPRRGKYPACPYRGTAAKRACFSIY